MFFYSVSVLAKNNCDVNASLINPSLQSQSGIGGTGIGGGIGGTVAQEYSIRGTGHVVNDVDLGRMGIIGVITELRVFVSMASRFTMTATLPFSLTADLLQYVILQ